MTPKDGKFNSLSEVVNASIDTSTLLGTYTVNVKGWLQPLRPVEAILSIERTVEWCYARS